MRPASANIVLVVLDCVRQKNLEGVGLAGGPATPSLDRLAEDGMVFSNAVAPANWTLPSHMSLLSGIYPSEHGVRSVQRRLESTPPLLAQRLSEQGYSTGLFTEQAHLSGDSGLAEGYQLCRTSEPFGAPVRGLAAGLPAPGSAGAGAIEALSRLFVGRRAALAIPGGFVIHRERLRLKERLAGPGLVREACRWIAERSRDRPFHLLLNCVDAHEPYPLSDRRLPPLRPSELLGLLPASLLLQASERSRRAALERLERAYALEIQRADQKLGLVLGALERAKLLDETAVLVTSDHGQQFGESGNVFHSGGVSDAVARVPLIVRLPDGISCRGRTDRWTSLCSIPDWSLALARGESPFGQRDQQPSRWPTLAGQPAVYCEGSPAHEVNSVFAHRFAGAAWNHRLIARYAREGKAVFDLDSGALARWSEGVEYDTAAPDVTFGEEASAQAEGLFPPIMMHAPSLLPPAGGGSRTITPIEEHLAAWGYS
ncbi:MAG: sulfatase [Thermoplasmata archaeon]|nr:sulfatase [Thermoplasmata archaeon]